MTSVLINIFIFFIYKCTDVINKFINTLKVQMSGVAFDGYVNGGI